MRVCQQASARARATLTHTQTETHARTNPQTCELARARVRSTYNVVLYEMDSHSLYPHSPSYRSRRERARARALALAQTIVNVLEAHVKWALIRQKRRDRNVVVAIARRARHKRVQPHTHRDF